MRRLLAIALFLLPQTLAAQERWWVQIEARPSLVEAQQRAQFFAEDRQNVVGFYLGTGWYGIALGPYSRADAGSLMSTLKSSGAIPIDSFLSRGRSYRTQFWPVGIGIPAAPVPLPGIEADLEAPVTATPLVPDEPPAAPLPLKDPGETRSQAAASEADLSRAQKEELQIALKSEGFYSAAIDGRYGRGTRNAMAAWQDANRYPPTGILSTRQRAELLASYNSILDGMDLQVVQDDAAGIRIKVPTGAVAFSRYDPPFVRFDGDDMTQVLLVSQSGGAEAMAGLYEVLQTLEIMPKDGPRALNRGGFTIDGSDSRRHSYAEVGLRGDEIKGFILVWPAGDEKRRARLVSEMQRSFERINGTLDPTLVSSGDTGQSVDLVSGLAIRKPRLTRTGFYVMADGTTLTTSDIDDSCREITIDGGREMSLAARNQDVGVSVLTANEAMAPRGVALFQTNEPRLQAQVALAGFPYGGVLPTAAMTFGVLADIKDLSGDNSANRLTLTAEPSEAGGPVFDNTGSVIGMLLPTESQNGKTLPAEVAFSRDNASLVPVLEAAGFSPTVESVAGFQTPEVITDRASKMTVLVSCWD